LHSNNKLTKIDEAVPRKIYVFSMEIRSTVRMFAGQFHPMVIIADRDDRHQDVLHLIDLLGLILKGLNFIPCLL